MDLGLILYLIVFGAVVGYVARLLVPGRDPMGCFGTILLGIAGSFIGGALAHLLFEEGDDAIQLSGILGSLIGAVIALLALRALSRRR